MNFCTECGHKLEEKPNYCPECGKRIPSSPVTGEEIQRILEKPWSQVTIEERKILCTPDLGCSFGQTKSAGSSSIDNIVKEPSGLPLNPEITKTWVIPPEGCPIPAHKLLDGQMVLGDEDFTIPRDKWAGYRAPTPSLFGVSELDENCTCFMVAGIFESGTAAARARNAQVQEQDCLITGSIYCPSSVGVRAVENQEPEYVEQEPSDDFPDDLHSTEEIPEVETIPEIHLSQEFGPDNKLISENFGQYIRLTKKQKEAWKIAGESAEKNFNSLCDWIPRYIAASDKAGFHQREKILGVLKRETDYVLNQFHKLGRVDGYEISMMQTLEKLNQYYDQVLFGEYPHHSKDTKRIIDSTSRREKS